MIAVGAVLFGYCGGYFGREIQAYDVKRVEAIGADWVVARSVEATYADPLFAEVLPEVLEEFTRPNVDEYDVDDLEQLKLRGIKW